MVVLVLDKMYEREDLVYDKHTGALIAFANITDSLSCEYRGEDCNAQKARRTESVCAYTG